ncbi:MAG: hypothetical protein EBZ47_00450 [Chlamydiae bacterium]|nr:hypothetical protein [Chlamydiota bacterium]
MQTGPQEQAKLKRSGKKVAVYLSSELDHEVTLELLSVLFEDSELDPISFEVSKPVETGLIECEDVFAQLVIDATREVIYPVARMYDCDYFILNYHKFYKL